MKHRIGTAFQPLLKDRWLLILSVANTLVAAAVLISFIITIQPRETQVIIQHSSFGITGLYRGYWYSLWGYGLLQLVITVGHTLLAMKLAALKLRDLARALLWLTIGLSVILALFAHSVIRVASVG